MVQLELGAENPRWPEESGSAPMKKVLGVLGGLLNLSGAIFVK